MANTVLARSGFAEYAVTVVAWVARVPADLDAAATALPRAASRGSFRAPGAGRARADRAGSRAPAR
ncbi:hypothetical protein V5P93_004926 [Actinokineospora auranticolor]|uniref:hypothetical protein n=1 Tax=Actinokineospora auranticolor TaxID=155976 RepID=UPI000CEBC2F3|nr:hypothetical protein [Actinokineospora auranticolor]